MKEGVDGPMSISCLGLRVAARARDDEYKARIIEQVIFREFSFIYKILSPGPIFPSS